MVFNLEQILQLWESWGLMDVILPFILIFAVVFAALQKVKIFGEKNERVHIIIALVLAFAVVIPHVTYMYPPEADVVDIINTSLPQIAVVIVAILMMMVLVGLVGEEWEALKGLVGLISVLVLVYIFIRAANIIPSYQLLYWLDDPAMQSILVLIFGFGLAIWLIAGSKNEGSAVDGVLDFFKKIRK